MDKVFRLELHRNKIFHRLQPKPTGKNTRRMNWNYIIVISIFLPLFFTWKKLRKYKTHGPHPKLLFTCFPLSFSLLRRFRRRLRRLKTSFAFTSKWIQSTKSSVNSLANITRRILIRSGGMLSIFLQNFHVKSWRIRQMIIVFSGEISTKFLMRQRH